MVACSFSALFIHPDTINFPTTSAVVTCSRQADTLLERLLLRMSMAPSLRQRRNLAFCISELSVTEKGVKKMIELIK